MRTNGGSRSGFTPRPSSRGVGCAWSPYGGRCERGRAGGADGAEPRQGGAHPGAPSGGPPVGRVALGRAVVGVGKTGRLRREREGRDAAADVGLVFVLRGRGAGGGVL